MIETLNKYVAFLLEQFQVDINRFDNPWMYIPFLIPFLFYMVFFAMKWWLLLFPITLPLSIITGWTPITITNGNSKSRKRKSDKEIIGNPDKIFKDMNHLDGAMRYSNIGKKNT